MPVPQMPQLGPLPAVPNTAIAPDPLGQMVAAALQGYQLQQDPQYQMKRMEPYLQLAQLMAQMSQMAPIGQASQYMDQARSILGQYAGALGQLPGMPKISPGTTTEPAANTGESLARAGLSKFQINMLGQQGYGPDKLVQLTQPQLQTLLKSLPTEFQAESQLRSDYNNIISRLDKMQPPEIQMLVDRWNARKNALGVTMEDLDAGALIAARKKQIFDVKSKQAQIELGQAFGRINAAITQESPAAASAAVNEYNTMVDMFRADPDLQGYPFHKYDPQAVAIAAATGLRHDRLNEEIAYHKKQAELGAQRLAQGNARIGIEKDRLKLQTQLQDYRISYLIAATDRIKSGKSTEEAELTAVNKKLTLTNGEVKAAQDELHAAVVEAFKATHKDPNDQKAVHDFLLATADPQIKKIRDRLSSSMHKQEALINARDTLTHTILQKHGADLPAGSGQLTTAPNTDEGADISDLVVP